MDFLINKQNKIHFIFMLFLFLILLSWLTSTTYFRLKLAEVYRNNNDKSKEALIYEKILRKETISHALSPSLRAIIFPPLEANYSCRIESHFENAKRFLAAKNIDKAQEEYQEIVDLTKKCEYLYNNYSLPVYKEKKIKEIIAQSHFNLGKIFFAKNDFNPYPFMRRVLEIDPDYHDTYVISFDSFDEDRRFALFLLNVGLNNAASQQLQMLSSQRPKDALIHYYLALLFEEDGEWNDAIKEFRKFLFLINNSQGLDANKRIQNGIADGFYHMGLDFETKGDIDKAAEYYEIALKTDKQIIDCYYRLKNIYEKKGNMEEATLIKHKLLQLKPTHGLGYKLNESLTLLGYSLNELEMQAKQSFQITFFWGNPGQSSELSHEMLGASNIYRIDNRLYQVKKIKNLAPNSSFEINSLGKGFPLGWNSDIYNTSLEKQEIIAESMPLGKEHCLMLNNAIVQSTNCQTDYIFVDKNSQYLQSGWIKSVDGNVYFGRNWFDSSQSAIRYDYVVINAKSPKWQYYSQLTPIPHNSAYCRLWLTNYETRGKAYFDDILFIKLEVPYFN